MFPEFPRIGTFLKSQKTAAAHSHFCPAIPTGRDMEEKVKFLALLGAGALLGSATTVALLKLLPRFLAVPTSA